jgi:ABC-type xylose transport system permease subunit
MELLQRIFPLSFGKKDLAGLIITILIYLVVGAVLGAVVAFLTKIPIIGFIFALIGSLIGIYIFAGLVILILVYLNLLR